VNPVPAEPSIPERHTPAARRKNRRSIPTQDLEVPTKVSLGGDIPPRIECVLPPME